MDQHSFCRATRDVIAGKSVGGEDDPAEPPICQRRAAGSLVGRAAPLYGITTRERSVHASLIALVKP
jgi:hypothetical protein